MTTTSASTSTTLYEELAASLHGDLIRPADAGYDEARAVYNAIIDKQPAAIARCRDAADVISCERGPGPGQHPARRRFQRVGRQERDQLRGNKFR
jgi:hypothetical protein